MQRDEVAYLLDMLHAAQDVEEFASDLTFHQFEESRLHQNAILKSIEVIGEATTHITEETRLAHAEIPWQKIVGMRNHLVHGYFQIDLEQVWNTVQQDIPSLIHILKLLVLQKEKK
ncbi:MAG: DUF86 domain-containing protein [Candidatus Dadabacteria bacterium]|nr:DUF86 domain-containing protein [Candidatus Dadabacteria bacterium]MYA48058.1 DUF86 domain-containing protein [Candidatus Dadabacteria bacterium]MYG83484.1 DUF86 domain-containing protein [Candidatus Dadabacteria bacterium]MYK49570.1 DUF86 domain-containing protein [Candidatus Dadabacteria bacterium]